MISAGLDSAQTCDVVIAGGGPGGCATALSLLSHAPSLSVVLVEASQYGKPRLGETLPPAAQQLLEHLAVWERFQAQGHRRAYGLAAVWGAPVRYDHDFIFSTGGAGWHLDRTRFDAMLAEQAERRGARLLRGVRVDRAEQVDGCWRARLADGRELRPRFLVDATGRPARLARQCGARVVALDRLAGFARFFSETEAQDPRTLVEAFADGWWYTAGLPDGQRVVVCMTDVDIAQWLGLKDPHNWSHLLNATTEIKRVVGAATPCGPIRVRATESRQLEPVAGLDWLAVGDAASIFDPLSSQGVVKALRSGIFASYAIADLLLKGSAVGLQRYRRYIQEEFAGYVRSRAQYYGQEQRWPTRDFWRRRRSMETVSWKKPVFLKKM